MRGSTVKSLRGLPHVSKKDRRFHYVDFATSMARKGGFAELPEAHRVHILMMGELAAAELAASNIFDFDNMPWGFYRDMARQCWDEARHAVVNYQWYGKFRRSLGDFPAVNIYYDLYHRLSLSGRLAVLGLIDEAHALKNQKRRVKAFFRRNQRQEALRTERIMWEEKRHVHYGHRWLEFIACRQGTTSSRLMRRARAELSQVLKKTLSRRSGS